MKPRSIVERSVNRGSITRTRRYHRTYVMSRLHWKTSTPSPSSRRSSGWAKTARILSRFCQSTSPKSANASATSTRLTAEPSPGRFAPAPPEWSSVIACLEVGLFNRVASKHALGGRNLGRSGVGFRSLANGMCQALEDRLADVVGVAAVVQDHVEIHATLRADGVPEIGDQLAVERADLGCRHGSVPDEEWPAPKVHGTGRQCLVHRQHRLTVPPDPGAVAQGTVDRLAKTDAHILGRVVVIDVQVARAGDLQIDERVPGEQFQHVIKEPDARRDLRSALAIEVGHQADVGLPGLADDLREAMRLVQGSFPWVTRMADGKGQMAKGRWQRVKGKGQMAKGKGQMALVRILLHGRGRGSIQFGQDLEQPVDLAVGADADAETCRIARIAHQANENPALLELLESLPGGRASRRPDEVGLAVRYSIAQVAQGCRQPAAGGHDFGASQAQIILVLERGSARRQAEGVAVV